MSVKQLDFAEPFFQVSIENEDNAFTCRKGNCAQPVRPASED